MSAGTVQSFRDTVSYFAEQSEEPERSQWIALLLLPDSVVARLPHEAMNDAGWGAEMILDLAHVIARGEPKSRGKGKKTLALETAVLDVLEQFDGSMSSRQVYYQVVSSGAVENNAKECHRVLSVLLNLRREGRVPYSRIVDRTRRKHHREGWDGVEELLEGCTAQYRRDIWTEQRVVPMVCCEKAALEGIFSKAVDAYGASLWTLRGFTSESYVWEWAEEILDLTRAGKVVKVFYFGDHDPSGLAIEADAKDKLSSFGAVVKWQRIGLLGEDFAAFDLVNVPVKRTDSRAKAYLSKFGDRAAELDALPPDELRTRVEAVIESCIDGDVLERVRLVEKAEKESLALVVGNWPRAVEAVRGAA